MKILLPLALLLALLSAGCAGGGPPPETADGPVVSVNLSPTPVPTPTPEPTPVPYDYTSPVPVGTSVEDDWFSDAVFIGDSRTDGLRLYSGIQNASFLCYKGLTVFEVIDNKPVIQTPNGKVGVLQALEEGDFSKIYIMLGINELGYNNDQGFADAYASLVDQVRQMAPNAAIYLQSLIPVSTEKCTQTNQPYYITNDQIAIYNAFIRAIAAEKQVFYVNAAEALADETGELPVDASADGIHFHRDGYGVWYDYLKTHTVEGYP